MAISSDEICKLAELARIAIDEHAMQSTANSVADILDMIDELKKADTSATKPLSHPLDQAQRLRADEVTEHDEREVFQAIAPAVENGLYLVPRVIE